MTRPLLSLVAAATLAAAILARHAAPASACSCFAIDGDTAVHSADIVFLGEYLERHWGESVVWRGDAYYQEGPVLVKFQVDRYLKGAGPPTIELADFGCSPVGTTAPEMRWVVMGRLNGRYLETSECFGSKALQWPDTAQRYERRAGGPGIAPDAHASFDLPGNDPPLLPITAAAVALPIAFLFAAAFAWPRRGAGS
jgi:hypothetical protein